MKDKNGTVLHAGVTSGKNLFNEVRKSLTAGALSSMSGNERYEDFQATIASVTGNESAIMGAVLKNQTRGGFGALASSIARKDSLPSDLVEVYREATATFSKVAGLEGFSMENYKGEEKDIRAANITLNAQTQLQTKAAEALFASVGIGYHEEGATLIVRAAGLGTYAYGNTAFQSGSDLRPIFGLLRSGEMYQEEVLQVWPVYVDDDASETHDLFVDEAKIAPEQKKYMAGDAYNRQPHLTQMLKVPSTIPYFIGLTQTPGQRPWDTTDELESNSISVRKLLVEGTVGATAVSFFINTAAMSNNTFGVGGQIQTSDDRQLRLQIKQLPGFSVTDKDGKEIGEVLFKTFKDAGFQPLLSVTLTGNFQRQTGELVLQSGSATVFALQSIANPKLIIKIGAGDDAQKALIRSVKGQVTGASTTQNVTNINRGNFGYRIEVYDVYKHLSVQRRSPISVKYPVGPDDTNQQSLNNALEHMSVVINNQCSKQAFIEADKHIAYVKSINNSPVVSNTQGSEILAGQHFVTATSINRSLRLQDVVSAVGTVEVFDAISAALINEVADIIAALNTRSGLAAIAEYGSTNVKDKWTVVVPQNLARYMMRSGDARTIGPISNLEIVVTNFDSEVKRMIIVPYNDSNSEVINPLAGIGVCVTKENIVVQGNVTRNNTDYGVVMTLPTYKHWALNVVIGTLTVEDAEEFTSDNSPINKVARQRIAVDNAADFKPEVIDPNG